MPAVTWPGQFGFWLVISTRPGPAGGRKSASEAMSTASSKMSSHGAGNRARTACTEATGSRESARPGVPSWAASSENPAAITVASSAANCHATSTLSRFR